MSGAIIEEHPTNFGHSKIALLDVSSTAEFIRDFAPPTPAEIRRLCREEVEYAAHDPLDIGLEEYIYQPQAHQKYTMKYSSHAATLVNLHRKLRTNRLIPYQPAVKIRRIRGDYYAMGGCLAISLYRKTGCSDEKFFQKYVYHQLLLIAIFRIFNPSAGVRLYLCHSLLDIKHRHPLKLYDTNSDKWRQIMWSYAGDIPQLSFQLAVDRVNHLYGQLPGTLVDLYRKIAGNVEIFTYEFAPVYELDSHSLGAIARYFVLIQEEYEHAGMKITPPEWVEIRDGHQTMPTWIDVDYLAKFRRTGRRFCVSHSRYYYAKHHCSRVTRDGTFDDRSSRIPGKHYKSLYGRGIYAGHFCANRRTHTFMTTEEWALSFGRPFIFIDRKLRESAGDLMAAHYDINPLKLRAYCQKYDNNDRKYLRLYEEMEWKMALFREIPVYIYERLRRLIGYNFDDRISFYRYGVDEYFAAAFFCVNSIVDDTVYRRFEINYDVRGAPCEFRGKKMVNLRKTGGKHRMIPGVCFLLMTEWMELDSECWLSYAPAGAGPVARDV
jgi:hypothetical protein